MNLRQLKALEIAAQTNIPCHNGVWTVPAQSNHPPYRVTLGKTPSCSCDDFQLRQLPCKHIIAAQLVSIREQGRQAAPLCTDTVPKKPTYPQNWPMYNEAQQTEKERFQKLLFALCRDLPNLPQTGGGRRWTPMADMVFTCALKVYTTVSSRRFACDLKEAHRSGYLSHPLNSVSVCAFLENDRLTPVLHNLIVQSSLPLRLLETSFAPDSSGFSASRFVRWHDEKYGCARSGHDWVKAHAICGVNTNIVTAVEIGDRDAGDSLFFKPLLEKTAENFVIKEVPADKAYLSYDNLALVNGLGGTPFVPYKVNSQPGEAGSLWEKMYFYFQFRRDEFLKHYHQRSNMESTFAMVKTKFRDHVRSRTKTAMKNEVLCKFLCHNICVVHQSHIELGIAPVFWGEQQALPKSEEDPRQTEDECHDEKHQDSVRESDPAASKTVVR
jgi:transposase